VAAQPSSLKATVHFKLILNRITMKTEQIKELFEKFEGACYLIEGIECWSARELQGILGYARWENFEKVLAKAQESCQNAEIEVSDHFRDVTKTIPMPKGAKKEIKDLALTRYAAYLVAQNGDSSKSEIAFAQTYFAVQTRKQEIIEQRLLGSITTITI
jgi:DNA-damage-inducible protein D